MSNQTDHLPGVRTDEMLWYGVFKGTRLIAVEEGKHTAEALATRLDAEAKRTIHHVGPVGVVPVKIAAAVAALTEEGMP